MSPQNTENIPPAAGEPCFENLLKVLRREVPSRPTLFEFFLNSRLYRRLAGEAWVEPAPGDLVSHWRNLVVAFRAAGYDYATVGGSALSFPIPEQARAATISINDGCAIRDRQSFDEYVWPEPDEFDYSAIDAVGRDLPHGMKLIVSGPGGLLENAIALVGYETLCYLLVDDPLLVSDIFAEIGTRLVRHYEIAAASPWVGACISNDDWGFKTQTMLSVDDMRKYIFPWHQRIVEVIHAASKPVILHSCGQAGEIMEDIVSTMCYDAKHSFEDAIQPVEDVYEEWGSRIAIVGGIDVDFMIRASSDEVYRRSRAMLERSASRGSYALGTGNSVPEYIEDSKYLAMIRAAIETR